MGTSRHVPTIHPVHAAGSPTPLWRGHARPPDAAAPAAIVRLLQNLLSHALQYRSDDPPIVQVRATQEGQWVHVEVQDNGIGIPEQDARHLFGHFQRLHHQEEYPGTGVGLATCRRMVEHHGGRIWFTAASPRGTIFHCTLPAGSPSRGHAPP